LNISLTGPDGNQHLICSQNLTTIGAWFAEHIGPMASSTPARAIRLRVTPESLEEAVILRTGQEIKVDSDGLLGLAKTLTVAAQLFLQQEIERG
jgi:hypothetical protein